MKTKEEMLALVRDLADGIEAAYTMPPERLAKAEKLEAVLDSLDLGVNEGALIGCTRKDVADLRLIIKCHFIMERHISDLTELVERQQVLMHGVENENEGHRNHVALLKASLNKTTATIAEIEKRYDITVEL